MLIEGPVHVAARAINRKQHCRRCSSELAGRTYDVGQLIVERQTDDVIRLEPISRSNNGTIYLCDEEPPAAFI